MLTLRWRDYPRERRIVRHRLRLGLLYPGPEPKPRPANRESLRPAKQRQNRRGKSRRNGQALPKDWDEIDINHLVLAKDEGPWRAWWEAIPIEKAGDRFKLRWRDYDQRAADHAATV